MRAILIALMLIFNSIAISNAANDEDNFNNTRNECKTIWNTKSNFPKNFTSHNINSGNAKIEVTEEHEDGLIVSVVKQRELKHVLILNTEYKVGECLPHGVAILSHTNYRSKPNLIYKFYPISYFLENKDAPKFKTKKLSKAQELKRKRDSKRKNTRK